MSEFFKNLYFLITKGRSHIDFLVDDYENKKDVLSFAIFAGFIIAGLHVISFLAVVPVSSFSLFGIALMILGFSFVYLALIFSKSALFYYLTGLADAEQRPYNAREILKLNLLSGFPFFMLPAIALIARFLQSFSLFMFMYILILIWASINKYKLYKKRLNLPSFLFKMSYFIPVLAQWFAITAFIALAFLANLIIIKTAIEGMLKSLLGVLKSFSG